MTTKDQRAQRAPSGPDASQARWRLDPEASEIGFGVRKMGLYTVKGQFRATEGHLIVGGQGEPLSGAVTLDAATVSTRMPPRDLHLRSGHFLEVKNHPAIELQADDIETGGDGTFRVPATVVIKGTTKRVELRAHPHAESDQQVLHLTGRLDRHEFGVRPPVPFEWIVGQYIDIDALLVFVR